jgi:hypothetical protein
MNKNIKLLKLVLVTPTHKSTLSLLEINRLRITLTHNPLTQHYFLVPESLQLSNLKNNFPSSKFIKYADNFFESKMAFNSFMLTPYFYESLMNYDYILMCELDSLIVKNIEPILVNNFTYLGAAWNPSIYLTEHLGKLYRRKIRIPFGKIHQLQSGNGGLSLRNTNKIYEILTLALKSKFFAREINEFRNINWDVLTVFMLKKFGIPPLLKSTADKFFIETTKTGLYNYDEVYGFHALRRYDPLLEDKIMKNFNLS